MATITTALYREYLNMNVRNLPLGWFDCMKKYYTAKLTVKEFYK